MEIFADILFEFFPKTLTYFFKTIWCGLLYAFSFGRIPFSVSWENKRTGIWGLVFLTFLMIGILLYFTFRGSYYFR